MRQKEDIKEAKTLSAHLFFMAPMTAKDTDKGYQQIKQKRDTSWSIKIERTLKNVLM